MPGMGQDFAADTHARALFEQAEDVLRLNLTRLMWGDDEHALRETDVAQPALLACGFVVWDYVRRQLEGSAPAAFAGHSVGEYTAAAAAGALSFEQALHVVNVRARAMKTAVPTGQGGMMAVLGLTADKVKGALTPLPNVWLANDNSESQQIISGRAPALPAAEEALKAAGAKRVLPLNVAGPFHTPLMQPAAEAVAEVLATFPKPSKAWPGKIVCNATAAQAPDWQELTLNLTRQIVSPVRWRESSATLARTGATTALECGSGSVLANLAKRSGLFASAHALTTRAEVDAMLETLQKAA